MRRAHQTDEHPERCGFAGTVGAEEAIHLPAAYAEVEIRHGGDVPVALGQALRADDEVLGLHTSTVY
jgi:hypothetical protein